MCPKLFKINFSSRFFPSGHPQCKSFYHCGNGVAFLTVCQGDTVFNPITGGCVWESDYKCPGGNDQGEDTQQRNNLGSISAASDEPRYFFLHLFSDGF